MPKKDNLYVANLAFLLNYDEGYTDDEMAYEIFKVAFQEKETVHYDRELGGNFNDLEQERSNLTSSLKFSSNLIESIYTVNQEKDNDPYIVVGYNDIDVEDNTPDGEYLVTVRYKSMDDILSEKEVKI